MWDKMDLYASVISFREILLGKPYSDIGGIELARNILYIAVGVFTFIYLLVQVVRSMR